jgi:tetratricopeptide (TPR) repeat protein
MIVAASALLLLAATAHAPAEGRAPDSLRYDSSEALRHYAQGRLLEEQGRGVDALGEYFRALVLDPESADVAMSASDLAAQLGEHRRSLELADRALRISPGNPRGLWLRGTALFNLDRSEEAIEPLTQAARADSERIEYLQALGRVAVSTSWSGRTAARCGSIPTTASCGSSSRRRKRAWDVSPPRTPPWRRRWT